MDGDRKNKTGFRGSAMPRNAFALLRHAMKRNIGAARKRARINVGKICPRRPFNYSTRHVCSLAHARDGTMCQNMFPLVAELAGRAQFSIFHIGVLWRASVRAGGRTHALIRRRNDAIMKNSPIITRPSGAATGRKYSPRSIVPLL